jgi:hypothetical protein
MSTDTESIDRKIHRLHDGDLSAEEREALEREIAEKPELGKKLEGLHEVAVVVRAARTDDAPIDSELLWKQIEAGITTHGAAEVEGLADEAPEPEKARPVLRAIEGGKEETRAVEGPRARRNRIIGVVVGTFAIAAATLLVFFGSGDGDTTQPVAETTPPETETTPAPEDDVVPTTPDYTEVLAVDFGTNVGTIFAVEDEGGQRYAVVWLDDVLKHDEGDAPDETESDVPSTPN